MRDKQITMTEIEELITMTKRFTEIYNSFGLCGISANNIHLTDEAFNRLFNERENKVETRPLLNGYVRKSVMMGDVEIMCLVNRFEIEK